MVKFTSFSPAEYLVYILSNKRKETTVGISEGEKILFEGGKKKFVKLIYFEKFNDRLKAVRRKRYLDKLTNMQRLNLVMNKNPELLNLIFTVYDN